MTVHHGGLSGITGASGSRLVLPSVFPVTDVAAHFQPDTEQDIIDCLGSVEWRLGSGWLYNILIKGEGDGDPGTIAPFIPNPAQQDFLTTLHTRTVILKARQLGFTTAIALCWTDHALFNANQRVGIIAHHMDPAAEILRDKVLFAYEHLPDFLQAMTPLGRKTTKELLWAHNNSSIRVATSMRSGTIHRLHVSELGKIAANFPRKAAEIITGSLPAVPQNQIAVIESTAEGQEGAFYDIAHRAEMLHQSLMAEPRRLGQKEWAFKFYPWFIDEGYRINPEHVRMTDADHKYFAGVEAEMGVHLDMWQRAYYVSMRDNDFSGDVEKMWREYPSTPGECWQKSTEGTWYATQLAQARMAGRIGIVPHIPSIRVNTFWDIGSGDGTAIWLHQYVGTQHRFIGFIENWAQGYDWYVRQLRETGYVFGGMFLPHDAMQQRQLEKKVGTPLDALQSLAPDWQWHIVPRVDTLVHGISMVRNQFSQWWFDEKGCKAGLDHLQAYKKKWNTRLGVWSDEHDHDSPHTEAADALRQLAQGFDPALLNVQRRQQRPRRHLARHLGASVL